MSTAAGLAIGLAASSAAQSTCNAPLSDEAKTELSIWLLGMIAAFFVGVLLRLPFELRGNKRFGPDLESVVIAGFMTLMFWAIGAPAVLLVWQAVDWLFLGGVA